MKRLLLIESDAQRRRDIGNILEFLEYEPIQVAGLEALRACLASEESIEAVIIGGAEDNGRFMDLFHACKSADPSLPILLVAGQNELLGDNQEVIDGIVAQVAWPLRYQSFHHSLQRARIYLDHRRNGESGRSSMLFRSLVGSSAGTRRVRHLIEQVASTEASVLVLGESGTGKEVVARNIHYHSNRRYKPFVPVNCGAIPPDLLESELFGHEKGSFTGAISARRGRFEMAEGGTLFLDEIGDMPLAMQVKLLRVLQERTFERVGGNTSLVADVRIIAATHANLEEAIAGGRFREDLYYRLNVFPIETPALRYRVEDLPLLINDLIARIENEKRGSIRLTPRAVQSLACYPWPGNVRELANLMERLAILYPHGVVDVRDLPEKYCVDGESREEEPSMLGSIEMLTAAPRLPRNGIDLKEHLSNLEYELIQQALEESDGIVAHAAKRLKMGRTTLVEKMRKYDIKRRDEMTEV